MKLGEQVQIVLRVPNLTESLRFYQSLGFTKIQPPDQQSQGDHTALYLTDGQNILVLEEGPEEGLPPVLRYSSSDLQTRIDNLQQQNVELLQQAATATGTPYSFFTGPGNIRVELHPQSQPTILQPDGTPFTRCGKFGEFSLPVEDFQHAAQFWEQCGFEKLFASDEPYSWGIFKDKMIVLGLHEAQSPEARKANPFEFIKPTMTYFAGDMPDRIARLKEEGYRFESEMKDGEGVVAGAVLLAPGGQKMFMFTGEI